ncbi:thiamine-phosphate kinase [Alkalicaulis satelles]|uniref:thiamine-phosphate kinase n=1 Tax=Alkalicaulis satelles TaxID=2609175 RepID=UPI0018ECED06|nr:thiamine-phosphate kinase [Alkalicaulis satelles]
MSGGGEFDYIKRRLAPLSSGFPGAADLSDDGAVITPSDGCELAVTADTLVAGVHFPKDEDPALTACRALRVNLSDLAAMGARPLAYMLSIVWPEGAPDALREGFADGLEDSQKIFGIHLVGGDTTSAHGPWTIAVTAFGELPAGRAVRRSGAKPGDLLVVTGAIGDAWLGLQGVMGARPALGNAGHERLLRQRFNRPEPRVELAGALIEYAHAAIDISDGLIADCGHIARASGLDAGIELERLPLSDAGQAWLALQSDEAAARQQLAGGGDDYELAIAVSPDNLAALTKAAGALPLTVIGRFEAGDAGVSVSWRGAPVRVDRPGFTHF